MRTKGWKSVFSFTFVQHIKSKSFIIGTIVICLIVAVLVSGANILPKIMSDDEDIVSDSGGSVAALTAVYLMDEAGLFNGEDEIFFTENGAALKQTEKDFSQLVDELKDSTEKEALVLISNEMSSGEIVGYRVKTYYSAETDSDAVDAITTLAAARAEYRNLLNAGVSDESYAAAQRYVQTSKIEAGNTEWNIIESAINYIVPIIVSLVLFMLIFCYGSTVAQSIATEKTSRVMELLLTSVRPLAVVIGKVLAMGLVSILQFLLIIFVGGAALIITMPFGVAGEVQDIMSSPELQQVTENAELVEALNNSFSNFTVLNLVLIFIIFILGFLVFALIAALFGACVSRAEDLQAALQPYSLIGVVGLYLAYFPVMFNAESIDTGAATTNPVQIFSLYFPLSSPFALPSALICGTISPVQGIIATLILAVFVVLIALLVSKVYEAIILHNGNRIKPADIIKLAVRK